MRVVWPFWTDKRTSMFARQIAEEVLRLSRQNERSAMNRHISDVMAQIEKNHAHHARKWTCCPEHDAQARREYPALFEED